MDEDGFVHVSQLPGLGEDINFLYIRSQYRKARIDQHRIASDTSPVPYVPAPLLKH